MTDMRHSDVDEDGGRLADRAFWEPHASPQSVWTMVALYPLLVLTLYCRSRRLLVAVLVAVVLSLRLVSPPETDTAWATRVVRGEQVWLDRGLWSEPGALCLTAISGLVHLGTFKSALNQQRGRTTFGTILSMGLMGLFFHRMVRIYEAHSDRG
jgi:hypothetical protein